jgi:zinc transport system substrate-binding protein
MAVMKLLRALAAVAVAVPLLAGCADGAGSDAGTEKVVASFYPLQYVAQRVVGDHAEVENLTSPGVEPHDLELSIEQTAAVADADIAFYQKGFQPAVDDAISQNGPENVVQVTEVIELEPGDEHHGESEAEHAEHAGDALDPHFWLDPDLMVQVASEFSKQMSEADPEHAEDYRANFDRLRKDLETLDADFERGLANCERDTVVVSHDAFGYLEKYGLHFEPIAGLSPESEPSPAHVKQLHDLIVSDRITTVFSETLASPEMSNAIAGDLGIKTAVLDPIEGLSDSTADEDYLSLMRANLAALQEANGCS